MISNTHTSITRATVPLSVWHQAEPLLETWRSLLQSLPGYTHSSVLLRPLDNGDVRCMISVTWEYREQLEEFLGCRWAPEKVVGELDPAPYDMRTEVVEDFLELARGGRGRSAAIASGPSAAEPSRYAEDERRKATAAEDERWRSQGRDWLILGCMMAISLAYHLTIFALQPGLR